jgi:hypothetical protein
MNASGSDLLAGGWQTSSMTSYNAHPFADKRVCYCSARLVAKVNADKPNTRGGVQTMCWFAHFPSASGLVSYSTAISFGLVAKTIDYDVSSPPCSRLP